MEAKYDKIGKWYNKTRQADPYLTERLLKLLKAKPDGRYLDIGCGTGNYTIALAERGYDFTGVDPSENMLQIAGSRNSNIKWLQGSAENIPVKDKYFNGIIATLTLHHWSELNRAFLEIDRVLTNNGRIVIFTSTHEQMNGYWLNHYFPKMMSASIEQMPSLQVIQKATENIGYNIVKTEKYFVARDLKDQFLYVGKMNPRLYFDESVRKGISSFSALANASEVENGLMKLKIDIETNNFEKIKGYYENDGGDYLFITISKQGPVDSKDQIILNTQNK